VVTEELLPLIPPGKYKYENRPVFVKYEEAWHIWGPEYDVRVGEVCEVYKYSENETVHVEVLEHVAYRNVRKHSGAVVKFVVAAWDRTVEEVPDASTA
jgi:hypothetical protein